MPSRLLRHLCFCIILSAISAQAQDLHIKKSITVGGNFVSSTETSIKGARERSVNQGPNGSTITLRQCDLKRTLTLNEQAQTYLVNPDPQDENALKAAALATGAPAADSPGGKIVVTTTITDTGERKTLYGYQARHLKAKVVQEPSPDACNQVRQAFEIDGWFADIAKEQSACATFAPPVQQENGCNDKIIARRFGSGKPGYPMQENITMPTADGGTMTVGILTSEISKQQLPAEMFDVPAGYHQVNSMAELNGMAAPSQVAQQQPLAQPPMGYAAGTQQPAQGAGMPGLSAAQMMNPMAGPAAQLAAQQRAMAQVQQMGMMGAPRAGGMGMPAMGGNPAAASAAAPQALGPKAPGKIRVGVAPPDAQVGQGSAAGADYSTPIRNAEIALMSGPAVEIAALDSHVPMQLQAEAQQKQCDYILFSSVAVKHASSGGFGRFAKMGGMAASMTPMGAMGRGMGGAVAAQTASMAASQMAQQQAMSQLANFNGQIKSKDDVSVQYQVVATGQASPLLQETLKGKAKSDGEDVLTPLLQQAANNVLGRVSKN
jgi:hypothetical protein